MTVSMREMLEAGVHFGHQTRFWNPKMAPYIYGHRNKIHIINLEKTQPLFHDAMKFIRQLTARRGTILMIGTKRQAREVIALEAQRCGMPYVDQRWLGGMLTNFKTVKASLKKLKDMQAQKEAGIEQMIKKEGLMFERELAKLEKDIGGIQDMNALPDAMFVIDVGYHKIAIAEAKKLGIPLIGVVDTNHSPDRHRLRHSRQRRFGQGGGAVCARRVRRRARRQGQRHQRRGAGGQRCRRRIRRSARRRLNAGAGVCDAVAWPRMPHHCRRSCPPTCRGNRAGRICHGDEDARNYRKHGRRAARQDRCPDDGVQEGPDRGRRRHGARRGDPARQARQQGRQGLVAHHGRRRGRGCRQRHQGALVEVNCETDFVSKNDDFLAFSQCRGRTDRRAQPGRRGRAVGVAAVAGRLRPDASKTCARA